MPCVARMTIMVGVSTRMAVMTSMMTMAMVMPSSILIARWRSFPSHVIAFLSLISGNCWASDPLGRSGRSEAPTPAR